MAAAHAYSYPRPSAVEDRAGGVGCVLIGDRGGLFRGRCAQPRITALALRGVAQVVMSRFYTPPGVLQTLLDPVVTVGRRAVRFEGFSGCCSTYARLDLGEQAFADVDERTPGTTNVDFQGPMRAALAGVRDATPFYLEVGRDAVAVDTGSAQVIEREVPFPTRWLKGLGEVQAVMSRMAPCTTVDRVEALRFLRALPPATRDRAFVVPTGRGLRLSQRDVPGGVPVVGVERLKALKDLLPHAERLRIYTEPFGASAWVLELGAARFTLTLTPGRWRGFSGEGQLLASLATAGDAEAVLMRVRAGLKWQDALDLDGLAADAGVDVGTVHEALAMLAARGLVGFDLVDGVWFSRELPFDLARIEALHPRLVDARKLVATGAVELAPGGAAGTVRSGDVTYRVELGPDAETCTCPWFAKERGERGPCKHVLAVQIALEDGTNDGRHD